MLQNRVDPFGNIIKTTARGNWMGNRGILHDEQQNILRPFKLKAWLTCVLEFNGRKRQVMAPHRYTELFFLDEATAFAAGHRPCFECRRNDYNRFKMHWLKGNPEYGFDETVSINEIDKILHKERMDKHGQKIMHQASIKNIPDGVFILMDDKPGVIKNNLFYAWSPFGYDKGKALPNVKKLMALTPKSVINTFKAGYIPQMQA
jgi:hypothetical protein